jgi:hypothetical protein
MAAAAYEGKSILFVAEKAAALDVVHGRPKALISNRSVSKFTVKGNESFGDELSGNLYERRDASKFNHRHACADP